MHPEMKKIIRDVLEQAQANPDERSVSTDMSLVLKILRSDNAGQFTEDDLIGAARAIGVPEEDIGGWIEDYASWLAEGSA